MIRYDPTLVDLTSYVFALCTKVKVYLILFVCFGALRPKSTAMFIAGQSVHLTTLFPGQT